MTNEVIKQLGNGVLSPCLEMQDLAHTAALAEVQTPTNHITATISDGKWNVVCTYMGSLSGTGPACAAATLVTPGG